MEPDTPVRLVEVSDRLMNAVAGGELRVGDVGYVKHGMADSTTVLVTWTRVGGECWVSTNRLEKLT